MRIREEGEEEDGVTVKAQYYYLVRERERNTRLWERVVACFKTTNLNFTTFISGFHDMRRGRGGRGFRGGR